MAPVYYCSDGEFSNHLMAPHQPPTLHPYKNACGIGYLIKEYLKCMEFSYLAIYSTVGT